VYQTQNKQTLKFFVVEINSQSSSQTVTFCHKHFFSNEPNNVLEKKAKLESLIFAREKNKTKQNTKKKQIFSRFFVDEAKKAAASQHGHVLHSHEEI
jgi:hypothetical protein